jgi:biopolymer transport protein ExbD
MNSYLNNHILNRPLENESLIKPKANRATKALVATLILTSLVDAFSILVIYLLMNSSASQELNLEKEIKLPMATQSDVLDAGVVVSISPSGYKIGEDLVKEDEIFDKLKATRELLAEEGEDRSKKLIVQADKNSVFEKINPLVMAGTQSGFSTIKFAVMPDESSEGKKL